MSTVFVEDQVEVRSDIDTDEVVRSPVIAAFTDDGTLAVELGIWLSGLESFLASGHHSFADRRSQRQSTDSTREFRLVHSALQRCSMLGARLTAEPGRLSIAEFTDAEMADLVAVFRDTMLS